MQNMIKTQLEGELTFLVVYTPDVHCSINSSGPQH